MQIYIHRDGQQFGPYTVDEIGDLLTDGTLSQDDLAWYEGAEGWLPLHQLFQVETHIEEEAPIKEPEPAPEDAAEPEPEPEPVAEAAPTLFTAPEPVPAPVCVAEPSWVPPRRDGSASTPFAQPARLPLPGAMGFATPQRAAPIPPTPAASPAPVAVSRPAPPQPPAPPAPVPQSQARARAPRQFAASPYRGRAIRDLVVGGLFFFGGTAVTVFTYEDAVSRPGGGTYFFAWGAILFGGIQFVRGLILLVK